jgi:hypothetical protein
MKSSKLEQELLSVFHSCELEQEFEGSGELDGKVNYCG